MIALPNQDAMLKTGRGRFTWPTEALRISQSSIPESAELYGAPRYTDPSNGVAEFDDGMLAAITQAEDDSPADFTERVWYIGAGADGCVDFD